MKTIKNNPEESIQSYDFSKGVRGKHFKQMQEGYTVTEFSPNKEEYQKQIAEQTNYMKIDKDVSEIFKTSEEINNALRAIIAAIPKQSRNAAHI
ncbi:MAG: hypothetical protein NT007_05015 [Candidatus Kapabacteria bacterium]|nr:hypothetical protein [Candidatus Kapabacteria bacterium]